MQLHILNDTFASFKPSNHKLNPNYLLIKGHTAQEGTSLAH
jgi:hypothetical protein